MSSSPSRAAPVGAPDHDAAQVFAAATGGGMSSRLFQEVREKRGLAYSIYSFHWDYADTGLFGVYAGSADRDAAEVVAASLDCLAQAAHSLEEGEIRRARAQMKVSLLTALDSPAARAQQLARQMQIYGRPLSLDEMIARVDAISADDVRKTGAAMLKIVAHRRNDRRCRQGSPPGPVAEALKGGKSDGAIRLDTIGQSRAASAWRRALSASGDARISPPGRSSGRRAAPSSSRGSRPGRTTT